MNSPSLMGEVLSLVHAVLFFSVVFASAVTDAARGKVSNWACGIGIAGGLLLAFLRGGLNGGECSFLGSLAASGIAFALFFLYYLLGGLGAGDVKLMAAVGALGGSWKFSLWAIANTAFAGVPLAIGFLLYRGKLKNGLKAGGRSMFRWRIKRTGEEQPLPYAVAICFGAVWTAWLFHSRGVALPFWPV